MGKREAQTISATGRNHLEIKRFAAFGFTLVELMLVSALTLTLVALSVPQFKNSFQDLQVKNAAFNIRKLMYYAQGEAVLKHKIFKIRCDSGQGRLELLAGASEANFEPLPGRFGRALVLPADIHAESSQAEILFYPDGRCDPLEIGLAAKKGARYKISLKGFGGRIDVEETD